MTLTIEALIEAIQNSRRAKDVFGDTENFVYRWIDADLLLENLRDKLEESSKNANKLK
jgi:hypothetical protein